MAILIRHGGESHVMRPDGVMRTSVIRPFVGYSPQADVQAVAQAFTTGGPLATTLGGFGAPGGGVIATWWANLKANIAARKMEKAAIKQAIQQSSPGPEQNMASQVAPQMQAQMHMLRHLTHGANQGQVTGPLRRAMRTLADRRPITFYRAG